MHVPNPSRALPEKTGSGPVWLVPLCLGPSWQNCRLAGHSESRWCSMCHLIPAYPAERLSFMVAELHERE